MCQREARVGQKNGLVRQWARRGTRPRQPADQRYDSAYLSGAICPARGTGAALALAFADTEAMQLHLEEISRNVALGAHAVLIFDRAGWHTTPNLVMPKNITPIWLPSRAPEVNPAENIWQYLRANWLSNRVFETFDQIIDAVRQAWNKLIAQTSSDQSACEIGLTSVTIKGFWYYRGNPYAAAGLLRRDKCQPGRAAHHCSNNNCKNLLYNKPFGTSCRCAGSLPS